MGILKKETSIEDGKDATPPLNYMENSQDSNFMKTPQIIARYLPFMRMLDPRTEKQCKMRGIKLGWAFFSFN